MKKELYVVEFESANYCGAPEYCRVWADSEDEAMFQAEMYAEDFYCEQDEDQYMDENKEYPDCWAHMCSAVLQEGSEYEEFIADPVQANTYYPIVN
jgi:hypothetical protein